MENTIIESQLKNGRKIFGLGLSRTGTKSLTIALTQLGFRITHYPLDEVTYKELLVGKYDFSLLNHYDGITDITVSPYYAQLDLLYPGSKFILTVRDKDLWLRGIERHWAARPVIIDPSSASKKGWANRLVKLTRKPSEQRLREREMKRFLRVATYGIYQFHRERLSYAYDLHCRNVDEYFKDRPEALLTMDITAGEGWEKLCPFLDVPLVKEPFPHQKNKLS